MKTKKYLSIMLVASSASLMLAAPTHASTLTTYTYTAPITSWYDATGHNWQLYAGLDGSDIKLEFTTAAPLINIGCGSNPYSIYCQTDVMPQVLSWHYNGGSSFMNLGSDIGGTLTGLLLSTDASGNVLNDRFYLNGSVVIPGLEPYQSSMTEAHDGYDQQVLYSTYGRFVTYGYMYAPIYGGLAEGMSNMNGAGQWTVTTSSPVPVPAAALLLGSGLLGLIGVARHKAA